MTKVQREKIEIAFDKILDVVRASKKGERNTYLRMTHAWQNLYRVLDEATEEDKG